jgi:pimeloyl-ACP methyl ester carboxylesterase
MVVIQSEDDRLIPPGRGPAFADLTGAELIEIEGAGHCPHTRDPVRMNHLMRGFAERSTGARRR